MSETRILLEVYQDGRLFAFDSEEWDWKYYANGLIVMWRGKDGKDETWRFYGTFAVREREVDVIGKKAEA